MRYIRAYWFSLIVMLVFAVASTVFTIIGPKILGNATNKLVEGISQQMVYDKVTEQLPEGLTLPEGHHRRRPNGFDAAGAKRNAQPVTDRYVDGYEL